MRLNFGTKVEWMPMARRGGYFRIYGLTCGRFMLGILVDSPVKLQIKERTND